MGTVNNIIMGVEDFTAICRICLSKEKEILQLFEPEDLRIIFKKITDIDLEEDDEKLPKNICKMCIGKLDDITCFIEFAKINDKALKDLLIKVEYSNQEISEEYLDLPFITSSDNESVKEEEIVEDEKKFTDTPTFNGEIQVQDTKYDGKISRESVEKLRKVKKKVAICKVCNERFNSLQELKRHRKENQQCVTRRTTQTCQTCNLKFETLKELREHQKQNESCKVLKNKCSIYGRTFEAAYKLKEHLRAHTGETPYQCKICGKKFKFAQNLRRHDNISHKGIKPFKCDICGKEFARLERKMQHIKVHTLKCEYCGKALCQDEYEKHIEEHKLEGHQKIANNLTCRFCGKICSRRSEYNEHLIEHKIENGEIRDEETKCTVCNKLFSTKHALWSHQLIHAGKKDYLCTICGKGFLKKCYLDIHLMTHTDLKPHKCQECGKRFKTASAYNTHILIHSGQRSYKCDFCGKCFVQSAHLRRHYLVHTGEKQFKCSYCDKSFALKCNLKTHTRIHTGEMPFYCPICNKGFYDTSSLKKHKQGHMRNN